MTNFPAIIISFFITSSNFNVEAYVLAGYWHSLRRTINLDTNNTFGVDEVEPFFDTFYRFKEMRSPLTETNLITYRILSLKIH